MRRHLRRFPAALLLALAPTVLGTLTALLYTEAGHRTLGRVASQELTRMFLSLIHISEPTRPY